MKSYCQTDVSRTTCHLSPPGVLVDDCGPNVISFSCTSVVLYLTLCSCCGPTLESLRPKLLVVVPRSLSSGLHFTGPEVVKGERSDGLTGESCVYYYQTLE